MKMIFKSPRIFQRMHDGPLGSCVESYAAEMREQGYCAGARSRSTMTVQLDYPTDLREAVAV